MRLLIAVILSISLLACNQQAKKTTQIEVTKYVQSFDSIHLEGSVNGVTLIYDPSTLTYYCNDTTLASKGTVPASTFKIANSIIGMQTGNVDPDTSIFRWDGEPRYLKSWETDQFLAEAFKNSCVPCYQELARNIGVDSMRHYLDLFDYGNIVFDTSSLDMFWLRGESKITLYEQVEFIKKVFTRKLPIDIEVNDRILEIMKTQDNEDHTLYGKTGLALLESETIGWFVGAVKSGPKYFYFATRIEGSSDDTQLIMGDRIKKTIEAFQSLNIIK